MRNDLETSVETPQGLALAVGLVQVGAKMAAASAAVFCLTFAILAVILGILLGGGSYWIAVGEASWRGWTALGCGIVCALLASGFLAARFAILHTVCQLVRKAGVGEEILKNLLAACGVSEVPGGVSVDLSEELRGPMAAVRTHLETAGLASELHGLPIRDLKARVEVVVSGVLDHKLTARAPFKWIVKGVRRVLVWAVVRIVAKIGTDPAAAEPCIDLPRLRAHLGANLDELIIDQVNGGRVRLVLAVSGVAWLVATSIAMAIRALAGGA